MSVSRQDGFDQFRRRVSRSWRTDLTPAFTNWPRDVRGAEIYRTPVCFSNKIGPWNSSHRRAEAHSWQVPRGITPGKLFFGL